MTVINNKSYKTIIPLKKIEKIYFDQDKDYKGNCDFSISTNKNEIINYDLNSDNKNFSSYFSLQLDCSQEEKLGARLNDAFLHIKKLIPQAKPTNNEPF